MDALALIAQAVQKNGSLSLWANALLPAHRQSN